MIGIHLTTQPDDSDVARLGAGSFPDAFGSRHFQWAHDARQFLRLDRIQLVIAADHERHDRVIGAFDDECLDAARWLDLQKAGQVFDRLRARSRHLLELLFGSGARHDGGQGDGRLEIRCVVIAIGEDNGVFTGIRYDMKLLRDITADRSRIGAHRAEYQPRSGEDAGVGVVHRPIAFLQRWLRRRGTNTRPS